MPKGGPWTATLLGGLEVVTIDPGGARLNVTADGEGAGGTVRVVAAGEVDMSTAGVLRQALDAALDGGASMVVVDLADVAFLDSTGIAALLYGRSRAVERRAALGVANPRPQVRRVLEITGVLELLSGAD